MALRIIFVMLWATFDMLWAAQDMPGPTFEMLRLTFEALQDGVEMFLITIRTSSPRFPTALEMFLGSLKMSWATFEKL